MNDREKYQQLTEKLLYNLDNLFHPFKKTILPVRTNLNFLSVISLLKSNIKSNIKIKITDIPFPLNNLIESLQELQSLWLSINSTGIIASIFKKQDIVKGLKILFQLVEKKDIMNYFECLPFDVLYCSRENFEEYSSLWNMCKYRRIESLKFLIDNGFNTETSTFKFIFSNFIDDIEIFKIILDSGNIICGSKALFMVNNCQVAELILDSGKIDINQTLGIIPHTAADEAYKKGNKELLQLLLRIGVRLIKYNKDNPPEVFITNQIVDWVLKGIGNKFIDL